MRSDPLAGLEWAEDLRGRRFVFVGGFVGWPRMLDLAGPERHVVHRGGLLVEQVEQADYLVVGSKPKKGKAAAIRKAEALRAGGRGPRTLDERELVHLLRPRFDGRSFLLAGTFAAGLDAAGAAALIEAAGGRVAGLEEEAVDFVVVAERRGKGKAEVQRRVAELRDAGARFTELSEEEFLELLACAGDPDREETFDVRALAVQLRTVADPKKVDRSIKMLQKESFQLYNEVGEASVAGVVRSQTEADTYYACWIGEDGRYACFGPAVEPCWGQSGGLCKHTMLLMIGLAASGELPPRQAWAWARAAARRRPAGDSQRSADLILRYRGALAGELDWRPTETVPEDYYAL